MANVIVTIKIMPESPDTDFTTLQENALKEIKDFAGEGDTKIEIEPIAFGLKALKITFIMDESLGSPDPAAEKIQEFDTVNSAEVVDVRRALG